MSYKQESVKKAFESRVKEHQELEYRLDMDMIAAEKIIDEAIRKEMMEEAILAEMNQFFAEWCKGKGITIDEDELEVYDDVWYEFEEELGCSYDSAMSSFILAKKE